MVGESSRRNAHRLLAFERRDELLRTDPGLTQRATQRADREFLVKRKHTTPVAAPHDNVASSLAHLAKSETLEGLDRLLA